LRLNQFQTAVEAMLNNAQINRTEWQAAKIIWHAHLAGLEIKFAIPRSKL
jgi:hypothetical protein